MYPVSPVDIESLRYTSIPLPLVSKDSMRFNRGFEISYESLRAWEKGAERVDDHCRYLTCLHVDSAILSRQNLDEYGGNARAREILTYPEAFGSPHVFEDSTVCLFPDSPPLVFSKENIGFGSVPRGGCGNSEAPLNIHLNHTYS